MMSKFKEALEAFEKIDYRKQSECPEDSGDDIGFDLERLDQWVNENYRAITEALELADRMQWQPIEDDPLNGDKLMYGCFKNGKWYETVSKRKSVHVLVATGFRDFTLATHFMPLPTPPKESK